MAKKRYLFIFRHYTPLLLKHRKCRYLLEIFSYPVDCQHFLNSFDCTLGRTSEKICNNNKLILILTEQYSWFIIINYVIKLVRSKPEPFLVYRIRKH